MSFDHGQLNIPGRTGSIDRELDRFNAKSDAAKRADAKAAAAVLADLRKQAAAVVDAMPADRLEGMARSLGVSVKRVTEELKRAAHWTPAKLIASESRRA